MAKLTEYANVSEKAKFFQQGDIRIVLNVDDIFDKLDKFQASGDFIFRGCSQAKYKLYNSAQRQYINSELYSQVKEDQRGSHYDHFVNSLIEDCKNWNQGTVRKLLNAAGIHEENALAYLSYMQHFGVPTPFLDFTFNPYMAIFFAIDGVTYTASDKEIDNYFSIYYTYQNAVLFESWKHVFNTQGQNLKNGKITYEEVNRNSMHILLPTDEPYKILNNTNIINQQGLFFYNNHPFKPLEEYFYDYASAMKKHFGEGKFNAMYMHDTFANCLNIHKSLIPYIKEKLKAKGITPEFVYPDPYKMKNDAIHSETIASLSTRKPTAKQA